MHMSGNRPGFTYFSMALGLTFFLVCMTLALAEDAVPNAVQLGLPSSSAPLPEHATPLRDSERGAGRTIALGVAHRAGFAETYDVMQFVEERMEALDECAVNRPSDSASASGAVTAHCYVNDRQITLVELTDDTLGVPQISQCIKRQMESWSVPGASSGEFSVRFLVPTADELKVGTTPVQ